MKDTGLKQRFAVILGPRLGILILTGCFKKQDSFISPAKRFREVKRNEHQDRD